MGNLPKASTLNTYNSALNRVFDEAVARGYMNRTHVPVLINKGCDSQRQPDFRPEEHRRMIRRFPAGSSVVSRPVVRGVWWGFGQIHVLGVVPACGCPP